MMHNIEGRRTWQKFPTTAPLADKMQTHSAARIWNIDFPTPTTIFCGELISQLDREES